MVDLLGRVRKGNVLTEWEEDRRCYILWGLQTDHKWQLKSQLILVSAQPERPADIDVYV